LIAKVLKVKMLHPGRHNVPTQRERAAVFIKAAFEALAEAGGSLPLRDVKREVAQRVELTDHDRHVYERTGYVRWESTLHFYSIDCSKAGFIRKHGGRWHLTPEGRAVMPLPADQLLDKAIQAYREWRAAQPQQERREILIEPELVPDPDLGEETFVLESAEGEALAEIEEHVNGLPPYDFQEVVAALLRGMGYATPFEATGGPDGGTDILAYPDPIGANTPHIRVQVKHRPSQKATREEIAALRGIIRQDREIGLFVSTSGFTSEAIREARHGAVHIELMDLDRFLDQWTAHYEKMTEEDKAKLRLRRVYFLAPN
jgi:restriction system protein